MATDIDAARDSVSGAEPDARFHLGGTPNGSSAKKDDAAQYRRLFSEATTRSIGGSETSKHSWM